jgi:two-component system KDP operon response regulator KdpE
MTQKTPRVLVVDDEIPIRRFINASLSSQYTVLEATTGEEALVATVTWRPNIILLDLNLPDMDGIEVTRKLREWTQIPIIVISDTEREEDKVDALDTGADDYLIKPLGAGELLARLRVALRHASPIEYSPVFQSEDLVVNFSRREVTANDKSVNLTPTEYDILRELIHYAGRVLTHQQLIQGVWGTESPIEPHLLRVNISNLRHKIESNPAQPRHIITEPGVGYRLRGAEQY